MKGIIQKDGYIKGENGKLYEPSMIFKDTILIVLSSWGRYAIKDVEGKEVEFDVTFTGKAYNMELTKKLKR